MDQGGEENKSPEIRIPSVSQKLPDGEVIFRPRRVLRLAHQREITRRDEAGDQCNRKEKGKAEPDPPPFLRLMEKRSRKTEGCEGGDAHHPVSSSKVAAALIRIDQIPHQAVPCRIRKTPEKKINDDR